MKRLALLGLFALGAASAQAGPQLFSLTRPTGVLLLRWNEAGGQLTGAIQVVTVNPTAESSGLSVVNATVRGTRSGTAYSMTVDRTLSLLGGTALDGMLKGETLNVQVPLEAGGFASLNLQRTTIDKFNVAVATLKSGAEQKTRTLNQAAVRVRGEQNLRSGFDSLPRLVTELGAALTPLVRTETLGKSTIAGLRARNTALKQASRAHDCQTFTTVMDADLLARPDLDEVLTVLDGQTELAQRAQVQLASQIKQADLAATQYTASGAPANLLTGLQPALVQARTALATADTRLRALNALNHELLTDAQELTDENEQLTCR